MATNASGRRTSAEQCQTAAGAEMAESHLITVAWQARHGSF